jgi:hypothetical protein
MVGGRGVRLAVVAAIVVVPVLLPLTAVAAPKSGLATRSVAASGVAVPESCSLPTRFAARKFPDRPRIDNRYLPALPGTRYVFEGTANTDEGIIQRRIVTTVTDMTKVVNGVRTVVIWDRDFNDGVLAEEELAFWAQDKQGNVWNLGEYPEEYEDGEFVGAPSTWIAGQDRARAGVIMLAQPRVGALYLQGFAPAVEFFDCAEVVRNGVRACTPLDCYDRVLVVDESSPLEPDSGVQRKFHAPGVGVVRITAIGDPEAETLTLTRVTKLGPEGLQAARKAVRRLERRAYRISEVYQTTEPARRGVPVRDHREG